MSHHPHRRHLHPGMPDPGFGAVPVGSVIAYAGKLPAHVQAAAGAPVATVTNVIEAWGWTLCDGRSVPIAQYPELYAVLLDLYGPIGSDGSFQIPDYRGYFLRGVDGGAGRDPDTAQRVPSGSGSKAEVGSVQQDSVRNHEHGVDPGGAPTVEAGGPPAAVKTKITNDNTVEPELAAGVSGHETRPKNIYVNYLIRFTASLRHAP